MQSFVASAAVALLALGRGRGPPCAVASLALATRAPCNPKASRFRGAAVTPHFSVCVV